MKLNCCLSCLLAKRSLICVNASPELATTLGLLAKQYLLEGIEKTTGQRLDPSLPVLGFARRMTAYKRPDLLFSQLDRCTATNRKSG